MEHPVDILYFIQTLVGTDRRTHHKIPFNPIRGFGRSSIRVNFVTATYSR